VDVKLLELLAQPEQDLRAAIERRRGRSVRPHELFELVQNPGALTIERVHPGHDAHSALFVCVRDEAQPELLPSLLCALR
jgi:hypothetical protein